MPEAGLLSFTCAVNRQSFCFVITLVYLSSTSTTGRGSSASEKKKWTQLRSEEASKGGTSNRNRISLASSLYKSPNSISRPPADSVCLYFEINFLIFTSDFMAGCTKWGHRNTVYLNFELDTLCTNRKETTKTIGKSRGNCCTRCQYQGIGSYSPSWFSMK